MSRIRSFKASLFLLLLVGFTFCLVPVAAIAEDQPPIWEPNPPPPPPPGGGGAVSEWSELSWDLVGSAAAVISVLTAV